MSLPALLDFVPTRMVVSYSVPIVERSPVGCGNTGSHRLFNSEVGRVEQVRTSYSAV